eukprot:COSAG01_NODE_7186_length_3309_cov_30.878656_4_plen_394_part_00
MICDANGVPLDADNVKQCNATRADAADAKVAERTARQQDGSRPADFTASACYTRVRRPILEQQTPDKDPAHYEALISQEWKQVKKVSSTAKAYFEEIAKETTEYRFADQLREVWASVTEVSLVGAKVQRLVSAHGADFTAVRWSDGRVTAWDDDTSTWTVKFESGEETADACALEMMLADSQQRHQLRQTGVFTTARASQTVPQRPQPQQPTDTSDGGDHPDVHHGDSSYLKSMRFPVSTPQARAQAKARWSNKSSCRYFKRVRPHSISRGRDSSRKYRQPRLSIPYVVSLTFDVFSTDSSQREIGGDAKRKDGRWSFLQSTARRGVPREVIANAAMLGDNTDGSSSEGEGAAVGVTQPEAGSVTNEVGGSGARKRKRIWDKETKAIYFSSDN